MPAAIRIRRALLPRLVELARGEPETECCGLLAGAGGTITEILPARNALASATAFEIAPPEIFRLFRHMRRRRLDHLGIYHSHPSTDNAPSPTDIAQAFYPGVAYFIISPCPDAARPVRAFHIRDGQVEELEIVAIDDHAP